MIEIIFKNRDLVVINKKAGVPSQKDLSNDIDAMTLSSEALRAMGEKGELWLVHRLDRVVGGLLIFARNKKSAKDLSALVAEGKIEKRYLCIAEGEVSTGGVMCDYIYKDGASSRAYVYDIPKRGAKEGRLEYSPLDVIQLDGCRYSLVDVKLISGRFHQIRAQFSHRKLPLAGDKKYGSKNTKIKMPALFAYKLSFKLGEKQYSFVKLPETDEYAWNVFSPQVYEKVGIK